MSKIILVIAAHADDEALGCGGTIAKHTQSGDFVHVIFMADGVNSREVSDQKSLDERILASKEAQNILGVKAIDFLNLPDNSMDSIPLLSIVQKLEKLIFSIRPDIIYTHHFGDLNIDHRITHQAVMTVCRPQPGFFVKEIIGFEVLSSTEWANEHIFQPNLVVDISDTIALKLKACEAYSIEMRKAPHSRSIEHVRILAEHRGYCNGMIAAEVFQVYRIIR